MSRKKHQSVTVEKTKEILDRAKDKRGAKFIGNIHALNKTGQEEDILEGDTNSRNNHHRNSQNPSEISHKTRQIDSPSLLRVYQKISLHNQRKGFNNTATWLVKHLQTMRKNESTNLKMLDVGAVESDAYPQSWIDCLSIDIQPINPKTIKKMDLLEMTGDFDIVNLSLVLNFSGCPRQRGLLLLKARELVCKRQGLLYIVLPLATVRNSRYLNERGLEEIMQALGFMEIAKHCSHKLFYSLWSYVNDDDDDDDDDDDKSLPRKRVKLETDGKNRNNFCILFP